MSKQVVILVPALNEELAIGHTVKEIKQLMPDSNVVVVDSNSSDSTADRARAEGAVVYNAPRGGKGLAVRCVLSALTEQLNDEDCLAMMDGDFTYPAYHLDAILQTLTSGADVVIGYRHKREQGAMTRTNVFGNKALSLLASLLYGYYVRDVCSGLWGFRIQALKGFALTSNRFTLEADMFVNAIKTNCLIAQVPITYRARLSGSDAKLRVSDGIRIGWFLIQQRA